MTYLDRIRECNAHDLGRYVPWFAGGRRAGFVRCDRALRLVGGDMPFTWSGEALALTGADFVDRSRRLGEAMARLAERGDAPPSRGEPYPVATPVRSEPVCAVDRGHVAWLGVHAAGVHVNGWVRTARGPKMWVAERSRAKPTFPGMLDNLVAGGQPHDLGLRENLVKECGEEAGIPPELAATAVAVGAVSYVFEDETGLKPDTMFCFDLELPEGFVPNCRDGEVERFELLPLEDVAAIVRDSRRFKFNCNLVVIDFLVRHGHVDPDGHGDEYARVVDGLRRPLPR